MESVQECSWEQTVLFGKDLLLKRNIPDQVGLINQFLTRSKKKLKLQTIIENTSITLVYFSARSIILSSYLHLDY